MNLVHPSRKMVSTEAMGSLVPRPRPIFRTGPGNKAKRWEAGQRRLGTRLGWTSNTSISVMSHPPQLGQEVVLAQNLGPLGSDFEPK